MKVDSLLVNTSRAELIEPGALYAELSTHPGKRAELDVFDIEPATLQNEPLLHLPNVLATPHLGYVEQNSYELYFRVAFENVLALPKANLPTWFCPYRVDDHVTSAVLAPISKSQADKGKQPS